jgi:hypothetical protein
LAEADGLVDFQYDLPPRQVAPPVVGKRHQVCRRQRRGQAKYEPDRPKLSNMLEPKRPKANRRDDKGERTQKDEVWLVGPAAAARKEDGQHEHTKQYKGNV